MVEGLGNILITLQGPFEETHDGKERQRFSRPPCALSSLLRFRKDDSVPCPDRIHVLDRRVVLFDTIEEVNTPIAITSSSVERDFLPS